MQKKKKNLCACVVQWCVVCGAKNGVGTGGLLNCPGMGRKVERSLCLWVMCYMAYEGFANAAFVCGRVICLPSFSGCGAYPEGAACGSGKAAFYKNKARLLREFFFSFLHPQRPSVPGQRCVCGNGVFSALANSMCAGGVGVGAPSFTMPWW